MREYVYERPWMYPKQLDAIFDVARYSIIEATTKAGKTVGCLAWIFEQALLGKAGWNYWWLAPIFPQAKIAYRRLKRGLPSNIFEANETELKIILFNDTYIWFKGADKPDSLYGEDVHGAVVDEASRCKEESWFALRSTLTATNAPVRIIGNVKGRKNWAYRLARKAESGAPNMAYHKLTCFDAVDGGILKASEIEDAKTQLPENVFRELYLAEPSDDGSNPFGLEAIAQCVKPISSLPAVAWGVDLAKSVDWTVCIGLDQQGDVCRLERFQLPWESTIEKVLALTDGASALVDSTGVGDPILETLQKRRAGFKGFKFSANSKQQIMEGLAVAIQQKKIGLIDGTLRDELECFEYEYTRTGVRYSAPEGLHDDCVCALALAWQEYTHNSHGLIDYYKLLAEEKTQHGEKQWQTILTVNQ